MTDLKQSHSPLDYRVNEMSIRQNSNENIRNILPSPLDFSLRLKSEDTHNSMAVSLLSPQNGIGTSSAFKVVTPKGKTDGKLFFFFQIS